MRIGVLAIHGSVAEHTRALESLNVEAVEVRRPRELDSVEGIILPGGESTTLSLLMQRFGLFDVLHDRIRDGLPTWGTCAGAILMSKQVDGKNPPRSLAVMDIVAERNAYGPQLASTTGAVAVTLNGTATTVPAVFIRAPRLRTLANADELQVLGTWNGDPCVVVQRTMLATSFHPELTTNRTMHNFFINTCL